MAWAFPKEVLEDREALEWIKANKDKLDLFDSLSEKVDSLISYSFEVLRDEELTKKYEEDDDWN